MKFTISPFWTKVLVAGGAKSARESNQMDTMTEAITIAINAKKFLENEGQYKAGTEVYAQRIQYAVAQIKLAKLFLEIARTQKGL